MKKNIYNDYWNDLSEDDLELIFDEKLGSAAYPLKDGSFVTCYPKTILIDKLKGQEVAMLECIQDRTLSTVYRIKQTGKLYQVCVNGEIYEFKDIEDYTNEVPLPDDELTFQFDVAIPAYTANKNEDDTITVNRNKFPRFTAKVSLHSPVRSIEDVQIHKIEWLDEVAYLKQQQSLRKMSLFLGYFIDTENSAVYSN